MKYLFLFFTINSISQNIQFNESIVSILEQKHKFAGFAGVNYNINTDFLIELDLFSLDKKNILSDYLYLENNHCGKGQICGYNFYFFSDNYLSYRDSGKEYTTAFFLLETDNLSYKIKVFEHYEGDIFITKSYLENDYLFITKVYDPSYDIIDDDPIDYRVINYSVLKFFENGEVKLVNEKESTSLFLAFYNKNKKIWMR